MTEPASPANATPSPHEALDTCHRCIVAMLASLEIVLDPGAGAPRREALAREILTALDYTLGVHLDDEEEDVFPAVLAAAHSPARHAQAFDLVSSLLVEHREMTELWVGLRVALGALGHGLASPFPEPDARRFIALCRRHIEREEGELDDLLRAVRAERLTSIAQSIASRHERCGITSPFEGGGDET